MEIRYEGIKAYLEALQPLQTKVIVEQADTLASVADLMAKAAKQNQRIFIFGTGHSHMLAEEGHYRAGGLACVVPILLPSLMLHESAQVSTKIERIPGLAQILLDRYCPVSQELLFVFSVSGVNALPIEIALNAKERGMYVVGVTNVAYCKVAPLSPLGKRLIDIADVLIDCGGVPGDTIVPIPNSQWRVGPTSTVVYTTIWHCLVTEAVFHLQMNGVEPPLYLSSNTPGATEHNQALVQSWSKRNPHL